MLTHQCGSAVSRPFLSALRFQLILRTLGFSQLIQCVLSGFLSGFCCVQLPLNAAILLSGFHYSLASFNSSKAPYGFLSVCLAYSVHPAYWLTQRFHPSGLLSLNLILSNSGFLSKHPPYCLAFSEIIPSYTLWLSEFIHQLSGSQCIRPTIWLPLNTVPAAYTAWLSADHKSTNPPKLQICDLRDLFTDSPSLLKGNIPYVHWW